MGKIEASRLFSNSAASSMFGQASDLCSRSRVRRPRVIAAAHHARFLSRNVS